MNKFLDTCNLPRKAYEETEDRNSPIMSEEIESVIKCYPFKRNAGPDFTTKLYYILKEKLIIINQIFSNLFRKLKKEILTNSFHEVKIILIPKPDK